MRQLMLEHPVMQPKMLTYMGDRMIQTVKTATNTSLQGTLVRLTNLLLCNTNWQTFELELINDLPTDELASLVGTMRAVVKSDLQKLKRSGQLTLLLGISTLPICTC